MELPFNFVAKTTAKAAQVMANFNALKNAVTTIENTLAVGVPKVAANVVGKTALAAGYKQKEVTGLALPTIFSAYSLGPEINIPHYLGEVPASFSYSVQTPVNFAIVFEFRVTNMDATNIRGQLVTSSPMPGAVGESTFVIDVWWTAKGQP